MKKGLNARFLPSNNRRRSLAPIPFPKALTITTVYNQSFVTCQIAGALNSPP